MILIPPDIQPGDVICTQYLIGRVLPDYRWGPPYVWMYKEIIYSTKIPHVQRYGGIVFAKPIATFKFKKWK